MNAAQRDQRIVEIETKLRNLEGGGAADRRRLLGMTSLGKQVLAGEANATPAPATTGGMTAQQRAQFLNATPLGQAVLRAEAQAARK